MNSGYDSRAAFSTHGHRLPGSGEIMAPTKPYGSKYMNNTYLGPKVCRYDLLWAIWSPRERDPT